MQPSAAQLRAAGLGDGGVDQDEGENDHDDAHRPGDQVEAPGVGVFAHQVAAVDKQQNEDQHHRQPDAVGDLREDENFEERRLAGEG